MTASQTNELRSLRWDLVPCFMQRLESYVTETDFDLGSMAVRHTDLAQTLLLDALKQRASDIHFEPRSLGSRVRLRIDGAVWDVAQLNGGQSKLLINQFKAMAGLDPVIRFTPKDAHATCVMPGGKMDLRLAVAPCINGETLSIRLLDPRRLERSLGDLGLADDKRAKLDDWLENTSGMFLAAGPTGCGKTTTVYALLHALKFANCNVVSMEDPVEYQIDGITQVQLDEKHHLNFAEGVRSMLRLDPDFLMMGEIRDAASAHSAVNASVSGRVLLSTIHSRDAVGALTALRNWGLPDHEIAESLVVVVAQRLVRLLCPDCRRFERTADADRHWLEHFGHPVPEQTFYSAGCAKCNGLGYRGRTGIFELWHLDEQDYGLILQHADEHQIRRSLAEKGHQFLLADGLAKVDQGLTSLAELKKASGGVFPTQKLVESLSVPGCAA